MPRLPIRNQRVKPKDRRAVVPKPKVAEDFYGSGEWKAVRERLRKERGGRCETPGCRNTGRVILHHIVERRDGGAPLDPRNLVFQCDPCHGAVTATNRQLRIDDGHDQAQSAEGSPGGAGRQADAEARARPPGARTNGRSIRLG